MQYVLKPDGERESFLKLVARALKMEFGDRGFIAEVQRKSGVDNLSRPLRGELPLPSKLVMYFQTQLKLKDELDRFAAAKPSGGTRTRVVDEGRKAFELLADEVSRDAKKRVKILFYACLNSGELVGDLLSLGADITVLVSDPVSWHKSGDEDRVKETCTLFMRAQRLAERIEPGGRGRLTVLGYSDRNPPFRAMLVEGLGLAIGPYQFKKSKSENSKSKAIAYGYHLPAVIIGLGDPASKRWHEHFEEEFASMVKCSKPKMTIDKDGAQFQCKELKKLIEARPSNRN